MKANRAHCDPETDNYIDMPHLDDTLIGSGRHNHEHNRNKLSRMMTEERADEFNPATKKQKAKIVRYVLDMRVRQI